MVKDHRGKLLWVLLVSSIIAVLLPCASVFSGCEGTLSPIDSQQRTEFTVTNPNI